MKKYPIIPLLLLLILKCSKDNIPLALGDISWQKAGSPKGLRVEQFSFNSKGDIFISTWWHAADTTIVNGAQHRIERSTDNGDHWTSVFENGWTSACIAIDSDDRIFAGTFGRIANSLDNGAFWETLVDTLPVSFIHTIAISPEGHIYVGANAGSANRGNYRSKDNGHTWDRLSLEYQAIEFLFLQNGIVLAGVNSALYPNSPHYIYRSTDNGETWAQALSPTQTYGWSMTSNRVGTVFAAATAYGSIDGGVYRSADNGETWVQVNDGLPTLGVNSLVINSLGHIFAGIKDHGVFRSTDNAETWSDIGNSLTDLRIQSLGMSPDDVLYAGTGVSDIPTDETESANIFRLSTK